MIEKELAAARARKTKDCEKIKPLDILYRVIHEIENGIINPKGIIVCFLEETEDYFSRGEYSGGLNLAEEVLLLEIVRTGRIKDAE